MNPILAAWNNAEKAVAMEALISCCAARRWAEAVVAERPFASEDGLCLAADNAWARMSETDWMEAFRAHPRIGAREPALASARSLAWSSQEQADVHSAQSSILEELATGNLRYEELFGFTHIVCATGKTTEEMLGILRRRLGSDRVSELREAAEQQRQITQIRLRKWLRG